MFDLLTLDQQQKMVDSWGIFLSERIAGEQRALLYSVKRMFVEVLYDISYTKIESIYEVEFSILEKHYLRRVKLIT